MILYYEVDQTLKQITQRGFEVSILGDTQNLTRHNPEQLALTYPALRKELGPGISSDFLPTSIILFDSVCGAHFHCFRLQLLTTVRDDTPC